MAKYAKEAVAYMDADGASVRVFDPHTARADDCPYVALHSDLFQDTPPPDSLY